MPLVNDPAREAVDSMRGYSYQILCSIDAWLDLSDGQILFLEGAEDLDRIDQNGAAVEQVKETKRSGNITLKSGNAIAAISNYWTHLERNPGTAIQFRYLTTSGVGRERGDGIKLSSPGIEAWEAIRQFPASNAALADAEALREFYSGRTDLPKAMSVWLKSATAAQFVSRIILPFSWITGRPDGRGLRRQIEAKLVELGETRGIGASDSVRALGGLHLEAWTNVTDSERLPLRRGDLLRIFDDAGVTAVPTTQLLDLMRQLSGGGDNGTRIVSAPRAVAAVPRSLSRRFPRLDLEAAIAQALVRGPVQLHGSTGMGKTSLAVAAIGSRSDVGWINLRDCPGGIGGAKLEAAADFVVNRATPCIVVLDDLDPGDDPRSILSSLGHLVTALETVRGQLLITGAQRLSQRIAQVVGLGEDGIFAAPAFTDSDIATYFISAGCDPANAEIWGKLVYGSTSGHPQLVDARLGALQEAGWPQPDITELLATPTEIVDVRAEARRMVATLPESEREMLCRASLLVGRASRQRLIAIARIGPPVVEPGHVIDRLIGPWLELTDTADLRTSPLLRNLADETRGQDWVRQMHGSIAWAWLSERTIDASDVSTLLLHSMIGRTAGPIVRILPSLLSAPDEVWKQIGETAEIYAQIGIGDGQESPFSKSVETAAFRILQLRIAERSGEKLVRPVVAQALKEADAREPGDIAAEFFDFLFLWQLLRDGDASRSISEIVDLGSRFVSLGDRVRDRFQAIDEQNGEPIDWPDFTRLLSLSFIPAVNDADRLEELADLLAGRDLETRSLILQGYGGEFDGATLALDRVWLGEAGRPDPDWQRLTHLLDRIVHMATEGCVSALAIAAATLGIRVTDENLSDPPAALELSNQMLGDLGRAPRILTAKAKVLWRSGQAQDALALYDEAIPSFDLSRPWLTDTLREAGMAAGRAGNWRLAAARFASAVPPKTGEEPLERRVGLMFEQGLSLHLAGETRRAVEVFGQAIAELIEDSDPNPPEPLLSIRQLGSHAIKLVKLDIEGEPSNDGPSMADFIGRCSSLDPLEWGDLKAASLDIIVHIMIDLDLAAPGGPTVSVELANWLRRSLDMLAMSVAGQAFLRLSLATGDIGEVMADAVTQFAFLTYTKTERDAGRSTSERLDAAPPMPPFDASARALIVGHILPAVTAFVASERANEIPFDRWLNDIPADPSFDELRVLIAEAKSFFEGDDDPWPRALGGNPDWETHVLAALAASVRLRTADELIATHSISAHYLSQPHLRELVAAPLSEMITDIWLDLCDTPTLLVMPQLSVPAIRTSVVSTPPGWSRIKAVLWSALDAVSLATSSQMRPYVADFPS